MLRLQRQRQPVGRLQPVFLPRAQMQPRPQYPQPVKAGHPLGHMVKLASKPGQAFGVQPKAFLGDIGHGTGPKFRKQALVFAIAILAFFLPFRAPSPPCPGPWPFPLFFQQGRKVAFPPGFMGPDPVSPFQLFLIPPPVHPSF